MTFSRPIAAFVLAVAAFMIFEWTMLGFNLQPGHPTAFYVVHGILIAVNIVIALAMGYLGVRAWKRASRDLNPREGQVRARNPGGTSLVS